jgi:hypothetical protein
VTRLVPDAVQVSRFSNVHGNIATDAFHNSGERFDPPKCHPNTRVAVLAEIMQWIEAIENSEDVL